MNKFSDTGVISSHPSSISDERQCSVFNFEISIVPFSSSSPIPQSQPEDVSG